MLIKMFTYSSVLNQHIAIKPSFFDRYRTDENAPSSNKLIPSSVPVYSDNISENGNISQDNSHKKSPFTFKDFSASTSCSSYGNNKRKILFPLDQDVSLIIEEWQKQKKESLITGVGCNRH